METEQYFKSDAKTIVDTLFDSKLFREDITRDMLNATEEYLSYAMDSRFKSHQRAKDLCDRIDSLSIKND